MANSSLVCKKGFDEGWRRQGKGFGVTCKQKKDRRLIHSFPQMHTALFGTETGWADKINISNTKMPAVILLCMQVYNLGFYRCLNSNPLSICKLIICSFVEQASGNVPK